MRKVSHCWCPHQSRREVEPLIEAFSDSARCVQRNLDEVVESRLLLCGARGVGGVVTTNTNQTNYLSLFDLEEDEEGDEDNEMEEA